MNFWLGGPDPKRGAPSPKLVGALDGHPQGARCSERIASISLTVTEKIAFENFFSTPPSGETVHRTDPISRTTRPLVHDYMVFKFRVPRPPRSDAIRLFRNLEMPYYGNERHREILLYTCAQLAKVRATESKKNSSTLSVIGVVCSDSAVPQGETTVTRSPVTKPEVEFGRSWRQSTRRPRVPIRL